MPSTSADKSSTPKKGRVGVSSFPQKDRANMVSSQPFEKNKNINLNDNQSPKLKTTFLE